MELQRRRSDAEMLRRADKRGQVRLPRLIHCNPHRRDGQPQHHLSWVSPRLGCQRVVFSDWAAHDAVQFADAPTSDPIDENVEVTLVGYGNSATCPAIAIAESAESAVSDNSRFSEIHGLSDAFALHWECNQEVVGILPLDVSFGGPTVHSGMVVSCTEAMPA